MRKVTGGLFWGGAAILAGTLLLLLLPESGPSGRLAIYGPWLMLGIGAIGAAWLWNQGTQQEWLAPGGLWPRGPDQARGAGSAQSHARVRFTVLALLVALGIATVRLLQYRIDSPSTWPDTVQYAHVAGQSVFSGGFWLGERPATIPLVYKALSIDLGSYQTEDALARVVTGQFALATMAWLFLAYAAARRVHGSMMKLAALAIIGLFGSTLDVVMWDRALLSESLSTSLFVLILGWILIGPLHRREDGTKAVAPRGWAVTAGIVLFLFSMARDANIPLVLVAGLCFLITGVRMDLRTKNPVGPVFLGVGVFLLIVVAVQGTLAARADRWLTPFMGVMHDRILPDDRARSWFVDRGMPQEAAAELAQMDRKELIDSVLGSDRFPELRRWLIDEGRTAYLTFLFSNSSEVLIGPMRYHERLLSGSSQEYRQVRLSTPTWAQGLATVLFPRGPVLWVLAAASVLLVTAGIVRRREIEPISGTLMLWMAIILIATALPYALFVWHADAIEVERHSFQTAMQLRLGLWLGVIWGIGNTRVKMVGSSISTLGRHLRRLHGSAEKGPSGSFISRPIVGLGGLRFVRDGTERVNAA